MLIEDCSWNNYGLFSASAPHTLIFMLLSVSLLLYVILLHCINYQTLNCFLQWKDFMFSFFYERKPSGWWLMTQAWVYMLVISCHWESFLHQFRFHLLLWIYVSYNWTPFIIWHWIYSAYHPLVFWLRWICWLLILFCLFFSRFHYMSKFSPWSIWGIKL